MILTITVIQLFILIIIIIIIREHKHPEDIVPTGTEKVTADSADLFIPHKSPPMPKFHKFITYEKIPL
jgi:hypothetical protein